MTSDLKKRSTIVKSPDTAELVAAGATKYDAGKSPLFRGVIDYFPNALKLVGEVSAFGANKYAWGGWRNVPDGVNRYTDGLLRHIAEESINKDNPVDDESGFHHAAHAAWNALARLELMLK